MPKTPFHTPDDFRIPLLMDAVDAEWIKSRLSGERGELARLARHMGIDQMKLSKILSGSRRLQAAEVPRVISFFRPDDRPLTEQEARLIQIFRKIPARKHEDLLRVLRLAEEEDSTSPE